MRKGRGAPARAKSKGPTDLHLRGQQPVALQTCERAKRRASCAAPFSRLRNGSSTAMTSFPPRSASKHHGPGRLAVQAKMWRARAATLFPTSLLPNFLTGVSYADCLPIRLARPRLPKVWPEVQLTLQRLDVSTSVLDLRPRRAPTSSHPTTEHNQIFDSCLSPSSMLIFVR